MKAVPLWARSPSLHAHLPPLALGPGKDSCKNESPQEKEEEQPSARPVAQAADRPKGVSAMSIQTLGHPHPRCS